MQDKDAIQGVLIQLGTEVVQSNRKEDFQILLDTINNLLNTDFQRLISILYRVDVSEKKLRHLLNTNPNEDAAKIIAALLIERQKQKIESRKNTAKDNSIPDDEKW